MRKLLAVLGVLLALCSVAWAAPAEDAALLPMQEAYPGWDVLSSSQWGDAAAAVLGQGDSRVLCLMERVNGAWQLVLANPNALRPGETPSILMDTDNALFWSYDQGSLHYSSFKENGVWGMPTRMYIASGYETTLCWENGLLWHEINYTDAEGNILSTEKQGPVPATWLESLTLADYQLDLPGTCEYSDDTWLNQETMLRCAAEVTDWQVVQGLALEKGLLLLTRDDEDALRLVGWSLPCEDPVTCISSPMPEGTQLGNENFGDWVYLPEQGVMFYTCPDDDGVWHISCIWPDDASDAPLNLGRSWLSTDSLMRDENCLYMGAHPWYTLDVDWSALPNTLEDALAQLDASRWATPNNPNPADRLHLRVEPDKDAGSLGKYYNGTPVEVLDKGDTWTQVQVGGVIGWIKTEFLSFGEDAWQVASAFPDLYFIEEKEQFPVWQAGTIPGLNENGDWQVDRSEIAVILGLKGANWYHIWFPETDTFGYMCQSDFWPGNG